MSIASAFNEITVAQGGTASKSGSITGAIDKLNDVLAGSDQPGAETIEQAIRLLGQHIGGGGGGDVPAGYYFIAIENEALNKTWSEINTMYDNGSGWIIVPPSAEGSNPSFVSGVANINDSYVVIITDITSYETETKFVTDNANGYPTLYTP